MRASIFLQKHAVFFAAWALALFIFVPWLPTTVQYGDSGELVGNAFKLALSHPPGFPLYQWLYHLFLKLPLPLTLYYQAALLNAGLLACAIGLLVRKLNLAPALFLTLLIAFQPVIFRQALLPDVFALHALLCVITIQLALSGIPSTPRFFYFSVALALACTNHPSAIYMLPLYFAFCREPIRPRHVLLSLFASAAIFALLYSSLLLFDRSSALAWPIGSGATGFFRHVLRSQYGTFQLSANKGETGIIAVYVHFLRQTAFLWIALLLAGVLSKKTVVRVLAKNRLIVALLFLYLFGFYSLANISPYGFGDFVLERFHLYPALLLCFLLVGIIRELQMRQAAFAVLAVLIPFAAYQSIFQNLWRKDSVLQDLVLNLRTLAQKSPKDCVAVLLSADSTWGASVYLETVNPSAKHLVLINKGLLTIEAYQEKIKTLGLVVKNRATESGEIFDLAQDLLLPNLQRCDFFTLDALQGPNFQTTVLPVGRKVSSGAGMLFSVDDWDKLVIHDGPPDTLGSYSLSKYFFSYYAHLPLYLGLNAVRAGNWNQALIWFQRASTFAPYLIPPRKNLCESLEKLGQNPKDCLLQLEEIRANNYPYLSE